MIQYSLDGRCIEEFVAQCFIFDGIDNLVNNFGSNAVMRLRQFLALGNERQAGMHLPQKIVLPGIMGKKENLLPRLLRLIKITGGLVIQTQCVQSLSLQTSVSSDGGQLLARIRRLVGVRRPPRVAAHWSIGVMLATVALSVSGLLQPLGVNSREVDDTAAPPEEHVIEASGLSFSQPEVDIPEPASPVSIAALAVESRARELASAPATGRTPVQSGDTPLATTAETAAPGSAKPAAAPADSPVATGAAPSVAEAQPAGTGSEATSPTESLLVTAPAAAAGSVVDRARMAAVDRVAQENGVKLVWLNPPVLQDANGAAPRMPSPDLSNLPTDQQARAIAVLQAQPEFPDRARLDSIEGWVTVSYVIGRDGRVSDVAIVAAQPRNVFEGAVRKAVRSWRFEPVTVDSRDLSDHLRDQITLLDLSPREVVLAEEFIGNIDEDGILVASLEEIAALGDWQMADVERALAHIQGFDPIGVGARDLQECLLLQLKHLGLAGTTTEMLVRDHLRLLQNHRIPELAKLTGLEPEEVKQHLEIVRRLDPKPGARYTIE